MLVIASLSFVKLDLQSQLLDNMVNYRLGYVYLLQLKGNVFFSDLENPKKAAFCLFVKNVLSQ